MDTLKTALDWLCQGIAPIPIHYRSKTPVIRWGKYQKCLPTEREVKNWFSVQRNLAIVTGWRNLTIIDFDDFQTFNTWQMKSKLPTTYSVLTARGIHCYYFLENPVNGFSLSGVDVKAGGGYIITPPSVHPSGITYIPLDKSTPILSVESIGDILDIPEDTPISQPRPVKGNGQGDLISKVKKSYPILSYFPGAKKSGDDWYMTKCPFHSDKHPSFWIDAKRGLCGCFAGCTRQPWDVIDLHAAITGLSVQEAIADMQERMGMI